MAETSKAHDRRVREGFFEKYMDGKVGMDLGVGRMDSVHGADLVHPDAFAWDKDNGDATFLDGVDNESQDYLHTSHILEHLHNPYLAIRNWFRVLKHGGYLIILVPHRDLYEKRTRLPSLWNGDHKFFILPDTEDLPHTLSLKHLVEGAIAGEGYIWSMDVRDDGWEPRPEHEHSVGEYSVECIVRKA